MARQVPEGIAGYSAIQTLWNAVRTKIASLKTSDLENDGEDGVHPFITQADIPNADTVAGWGFTKNTGTVTTSGNMTSSHVVISNGTTVIKDSGYTIEKSVPSDAKFTDTTYENKSAVSGGVDESLVLTGEKYLWNNKQSAITSSTDLTVKTLTGGLSYVTTAPTSANVNGLKIAYLDSEPATKYNGWLYLIKE